MELPTEIEAPARPLDEPTIIQTFADAAAAEIAAEALTEAGISWDIVPEAYNRHSGGVIPEAFLLRVSRVDADRGAALLDEAKAAESDEPERPEDSLDAERRALGEDMIRPRRVHWAVALACVMPVPGSSWYARVPAVGPLLMVTFVVTGIAGLANGVDGNFLAHVLALMKLLDVVIAAAWIAQTKRAVAIGALCMAAATFWVARQHFLPFDFEAEVRSAYLPHLPEGSKLSFEPAFIVITLKDGRAFEQKTAPLLEACTTRQRCQDELSISAYETAFYLTRQ